MSCDYEIETTIIATFPIKPIHKVFEDSLWNHLMDKVQAEIGLDCECIFLDRTYGKGITQVRYQFENSYETEQRTTEIGKLIDIEINKWSTQFPDSVSVWI